MQLADTMKRFHDYFKMECKYFSRELTLALILSLSVDSVYEVSYFLLPEGGHLLIAAPAGGRFVCPARNVSQDVSG